MFCICDFSACKVVAFYDGKDGSGALNVGYLQCYRGVGDGINFM